MWDVLQFPLERTNNDALLKDWEVCEILWWSEVFCVQQWVKDDIQDIVEISDQLPDFAWLLILYNSFAINLKNEFEKKYHQEINKSTFDNVVSDIISIYATMTLEYKTNIYEWFPEGYIRNLFKKKLEDFEREVKEILIENFASYQYSTFKFINHCTQEFLRMQQEKWPWKK